jgi:signal peptidase I
MEIETAPHRPPATPWGRLLLLVVVLGPVTVLVLLPIGLGLQRYVMTGDSMAGSIGRGTVVFERTVPVSDLRPGDVITYRRPPTADGDGMVTHRIVAIGPAGIVTKADAEVAPDPWTLQPDGPTLPRVVFTVPWIGWAYLVLFHPQGWLLTTASAVLLVVLLSQRWGRRRRPRLRDETAPGDGGAADREGARGQLEEANP